MQTIVKDALNFITGHAGHPDLHKIALDGYVASDQVADAVTDSDRNKRYILNMIRQQLDRVRDEVKSPFITYLVKLIKKDDNGSYRSDVAKGNSYSVRSYIVTIRKYFGRSFYWVVGQFDCRS
jgi:murein endopeptidase